MAAIPSIEWRTFSTVRLNGAQIAELMRGRQGPVVRHLIVTGEKVRQRAKVIVGKKSHKLERSIVKRLIHEGGKPAMLVGSEKIPYAEFHHEGTRPHIIRARSVQIRVGKRRVTRDRNGIVRERKGGVLVFMYRGQLRFAHEVRHPGTSANPYLVRALWEVIRSNR